MLPLGTAERWPGAARLKICVRTLLMLHIGGGPSSTTNERRLSPCLFDTQASKLIYEGINNVTLRDFVLELILSVTIFLEKSKKTIGNYFE